MAYSAFMDYREVLVTGGTGFVGKHVCRALIARGHLPRLLVREGSEGKIPEEIRRNCRVTPGDVTNRESVENAATGTGAIVHLVGIIREFPARGITYERLHVDATAHVVAAAKKLGIARLAHMSALGAGTGGATKYFDSKGRAEQIVKESGLEWSIFRPSVIFGPGDMFVNELAGILRIAPVLPVPGDGTYRLQPVYAGDVASGFAEALSRQDAIGRTFDLAGPERYPYNELLDRIAAGIGRRSARKVHVPLALLRPVIRRFERYAGFPLTMDQLEMLLAENIGGNEQFLASFGGRLLSLPEYLAAGGKDPRPANMQPGNTERKSASGRFPAVEGSGESEEAASFRKSA
jgi:NADH dehydrogenase